MHVMLKLYLVLSNALISGCLAFLLTTFALVWLRINRTQFATRVIYAATIAAGIFLGCLIPEPQLLYCTIAETFVVLLLMFTKVSK